MANARLYIEHIPSGRRFRIAKYFPSTGWYAFAAMEDEDSSMGLGTGAKETAAAFAANLQNFLDPQGHRYGDFFGGPNAWYKTHPDAANLTAEEINDGPEHYRLVYEK